jgi:hypothetical protein
VLKSLDRGGMKAGAKPGLFWFWRRSPRAEARC